MRIILPMALLLPACAGDDGGEEGAPDTAPWRTDGPDLVCPGDPGCETAEGALQAGAGAETITPTCFESWTDLDGNAEYDSVNESFLDCGCDRLCSTDAGYPGPDTGEEDGEFQAVWLAGFQNGRAATGVHDDLWARAIVLRQGETTLGIVALDLVGFFNDDVLAMRQDAAAAGLDLDHLIVTSTHQHEGPDTMGMWGQTPLSTGVDQTYVDFVRAQAVEALLAAEADLRPATLRTGVADSAAASEKGTRNTVRDSRDPVVIDERVYAAHFSDSEGQTIATLVNWGNHPEALSDENTEITSDFSHYLRLAVEEGIPWTSGAVEGLGGTCIFLNGTVGGLMTPLGIEVTDRDGNTFGESNFAKAEALGRVIGALALEAIAAGETVEDPALSFRSLSVYLPVDNYAFQALALTGVFDRETFLWDEDEQITDDNKPHLLSEVDAVWLGPIGMLAVPGELFPEIAIGGYDGSRVNTDEDTLVDEENPNPPDLSAAPQGPYFKDLLESSYAWILGLGNDEIGYIVPAYDFELHPQNPYLDQAEGDHYEETNSLGPETAPLVEAAVAELLAWEP